MMVVAIQRNGHTALARANPQFGSKLVEHDVRKPMRQDLITNGKWRPETIRRLQDWLPLKLHPGFVSAIDMLPVEF